MHILVTGGAGFIGSHIVDLHLERGDKVHVVDDLSTGFSGNLKEHEGNPDLFFDEADVLTWEGLEKAVTWANRIYHMAAVVGVLKVLEDPIKVLAVNIAGCERLLRAAHGSKWNPKIVIASSSEVYGHGLHCMPVAGPAGLSCPAIIPGGDGEGDPDRPASRPPGFKEFREDMEPRVGSSAVSRWNYSISKLADEAFGLSYARKYGMDVTVVRLFNTIGPRQRGRYGMVVPRFVEQAVSGKPISIYGDGKQMRSFCDVRDTVRAMDMLASTDRSRKQIVNVGSTHEITINYLAELIKELSGSGSELIHVPYSEAYGEEFHEAYRRKPNLDKLTELTGFRHEWPLDRALTYLIEMQRARVRTEKEA